MKYLSILFCAFILPLISIGQGITITSNDMPSTGDTIRISTALTVGSVDYTLTGINYTWDFTGLTPVSQDVDTFISVSSAGFSYYLTFLTSANQALKQGDIDFVILQMQNVFNFYKNSSSGYELAGYGATFSGLPIPVKYDVADRLYKFPLNYGNVDSTQSKFSLSLPSLGYFGESKKRKNIVDGWGTLKTPYGTFDVLRVKSEILQKDTIRIDTLGISLPAVTQNIVEYKWIAKGKKIPVLEIIKSNLIPAPTIHYIDSLRTDLISGIKEDEIQSMVIYPNPAKNEIFIELPVENNQNFQVLITDITGRTVEFTEFLFVNGKIRIDTRNYSQGLYFIQLLSGLKNNYRDKFIISK